MALQYTEHCAIFARYLINEIFEILHEYRRKHYYLITMIIKTSLFLSNGVPQSYHSSIISTSIIARTNRIDHFSVSTVVYPHGESTVRCGWCVEQAVPFRFAHYDSLFYGHILITNSSKVTRRARKAQKQTSFASQTSNCPTLSGQSRTQFSLNFWADYCNAKER